MGEGRGKLGCVFIGKGIQNFQVKETVSAEDVIRGFRIAFSSAPVPWMGTEQLRYTKKDPSLKPFQKDKTALWGFDLG